MSTSQPMGTAAKLVFGKSAEISQKVPVDNPTVRGQKSRQPTSGLKRIIQHSHAIGSCKFCQSVRETRLEQAHKEFWVCYQSVQLGRFP